MSRGQVLWSLALHTDFQKNMHYWHILELNELEKVLCSLQCYSSQTQGARGKNGQAVFEMAVT